MLQDRESAVGYAHENISPIWSASVAMAGHTVPAIATPYYGNGNIINYVRFHPCADRFELVRQTASALVHIHSKDVVHGDICPVSFCFSHSSGFWISSGLSLTIGPSGKYLHC
jgi:serine/threonine protein kinase